MHSIISDFSITNNGEFWGWIGTVAAIALVLFCVFGPNMLSSIGKRHKKGQPSTEPEFKRMLPQLPDWIEK